MPYEYKIKGAVTFAEYLECHKVLAAKRRLWIRGITNVYGIGVLGYGLFFAPSGSGLMFTMMGAILVAYGLIISPIQFRYRVRRNWDRYPKMQKEFEIRISPAGLETTDDKGQISHTAWDSFIRFGESESLFLLYLSPLLPMCLPKRLVPASDLPGLRALLSSAIGR